MTSTALELHQAARRGVGGGVLQLAHRPPRWPSASISTTGPRPALARITASCSVRAGHALDAARHGDDLFAASSAPGPTPVALSLGAPFPDTPPSTPGSPRRPPRTRCSSPRPIPRRAAPRGGWRSCASIPRTAWSRSGIFSSGRASPAPRAATEAIYLLARHVFDDLGYRRFEWKCDDRTNPPSARRSASACTRGRVPATHGRQGPQPRHRLVLDPRPRMAGAPTPASSPGSIRRTSTPRAAAGALLETFQGPPGRIAA